MFPAQAKTRVLIFGARRFIAENAALRQQNQSLSEEVDNLKLLVRKLKIQAFGKKTEKLHRTEESSQEELFSFDVPVWSKPVAAPKVPVAAHERELRRGRKPLPDSLERERIEYKPVTIVCSCCGAELEKTGEEVTEKLEYIPARFLVKEHVKIKRACSRCKEAGVNICTFWNRTLAGKDVRLGGCSVYAFKTTLRSTSPGTDFASISPG